MNSIYKTCFIAAEFDFHLVRGNVRHGQLTQTFKKSVLFEYFGPRLRRCKSYFSGANLLMNKYGLLHVFFIPSQISAVARRARADTVRGLRSGDTKNV